ncbi:MAG: hypothetical protein ABS76_06780 [Pelagibacterium sp. SCN 64-44]|nr:MAG: hypothetical protein ABS76_06780 [Pelagibacterium sp. SCN 64-44]
MDILLRLVGAFYLLAGMIAMRAVVMDRMMDQMLSAISMTPQPAREAQRRWLWGISALAIGMGGAALMVLSLWAVPLFLVGLLTQIVYLVWARKAFPPEDADEAKGRRQTINAAIVYGAASLGVFLAAWTGLLHPWRDLWALVVPASGLLILLTMGRHLLWRAGTPAGFSGFDTDEPPEDEPVPVPPLHRVRLEPGWGRYALVDADSGEDRVPDHYLPVDLADRIHRWDYSFGAHDETRTIYAMFEDAAHEAAHRREGEAIVAELKTIFGTDNASGPVYPAEVVHVGPDTDAGAP